MDDQNLVTKTKEVACVCVCVCLEPGGVRQGVVIVGSTKNKTGEGHVEATYVCRVTPES